MLCEWRFKPLCLTLENSQAILIELFVNILRKVYNIGEKKNILQTIDLKSPSTIFLQIKMIGTGIIMTFNFYICFTTDGTWGKKTTTQGWCNVCGSEIKTPCKPLRSYHSQQSLVIYEPKVDRSSSNCEIMESDKVLHIANFSTLFVCMVLKFPQIFVLMRAKSTTGVSLNSLLLELTGYVLQSSAWLYYTPS